MVRRFYNTSRPTQKMPQTAERDAESRLVEPARSACDTPTHAPPVRNPVELLEGMAIIEVMAVHHALVISVAHSNGQAWVTTRLSGDMPMEPGDARERPRHATITPDP